MENQPFTLLQCYQILDLDAEQATLENIEKQYYKLIGKKLSEGKKEEIINIKQAYLQLTNYYQNQQKLSQEKNKITIKNSINNYLNQYIKNKFWQINTQSYPECLEIKIMNTNIREKSLLTKLILELLLKSQFIKSVKFLIINGYDNGKFIWQNKLSLNNLNNNSDLLLAEAERKTNTYGLPIAFFIGFVVSFIEPLAWFVSMWIHEFGHATIAWFSGYQAMVTFAGTVWSQDRSLFVYVGILFLLILTIYYSIKEDKKTVIYIAICLIVLQFILTWLVPRSTYKMLLILGGIGGEFYLSTLLIVSFYWQLPARFYWEFWRFFALIFGSITFVSSFQKWHKIKLGKGQIPWGTFWGGRGDSAGDLNILNHTFNWSIQKIIDTYYHLSNFCLLIIIITYIYFLLKSNSHLVIKIKQFLQKLI